MLSQVLYRKVLYRKGGRDTMGDARWEHGALWNLLGALVAVFLTVLSVWVAAVFISDASGGGPLVILGFFCALYYFWQGLVAVHRFSAAVDRAKEQGKKEAP